MDINLQELFLEGGTVSFLFMQIAQSDTCVSKTLTSLRTTLVGRLVPPGDSKDRGCQSEAYLVCIAMATAEVGCPWGWELAAIGVNRTTRRGANQIEAEECC